MKFRCIYCAHTWEGDDRPPGCPNCATPFSLTVTTDTPLFDLAMALDRNGRTLDFELRARLPEQHPEHMDIALACAPEPDTEPRPPGCACHLDAGDSPCPVHGEESP